MRTLIELYDDRPIDNVLATEVFRPNETILICPPEIEADRARRRALRQYFEHRGCPVKLTFIPVSMVDAVKVEKTLRQIIETHPDCAIDIAGGTDATLFAAGAVSGDVIPVFTYSRKKGRFFEIKNAPFARNLPCEVRLDAESCFLMAGGTLLPGRVDNALLMDKLPRIDRLFEIFQNHRRIWNKQISYIQKLSSAEPGMLSAAGAREVKAGNKRVTANDEFLRALEGAGLILNLAFTESEVSFEFPDETVRFWLRDIGSVLELQVFRACLAAEYFDDVVLSAIVNWQGGATQRDSVTNEIDVVAVRGIQPVFISCKTCEIHTDALNELAILRDRFGGKGSRAIIATSSPATKNRAPTRRRAAELGIEVIEWDDLPLHKLIARLTSGGIIR